MEDAELESQDEQARAQIDALLRGPNDKSGRRMPRQKPGKSAQDYGTPPEFLLAVEKRFGRMQVDLAAAAENAKAPVFVTEAEDSLSVDWAKRFRGKRRWLNPPFARIEPWAIKCASMAKEWGLVLFLTPASVGANWFARYVYPYAHVLALQGRLSFDGVAPYPKDLILSVYGADYEPRFEVWDWRKEK